MRALTTTSSVLRVVCVDAYTGGWFTDELIPPTASAPPAAPRTPRKWSIGSLRILATGRVR